MQSKRAKTHCKNNRYFYGFFLLAAQLPVFYRKTNGEKT
jgi:hypothetical protein